MIKHDIIYRLVIKEMPDGEGGRLEKTVGEEPIQARVSYFDNTKSILSTTDTGVRLEDYLEVVTDSPLSKSDKYKYKEQTYTVRRSIERKRQTFSILGRVM